MSGGTDFSGAPSRSRHRHVPGTGTWTPSVPARQTQAGRRHAPVAATPYGPKAGRHVEADPFAPARGELPVLTPSWPPVMGATDRARGVPGQRATAAPLRPSAPPPRMKVTLRPPVERPATDDDEVRIHVLPPTGGLGKFDLGTVPASVTPPRSWRRAAWFAAASSGGVVISLLFAGSLLVGSPEDHAAINGWTDRRGGSPLLEHEQYSGENAPAPQSQAAHPAGTTPGPEIPDTTSGSVADGLTADATSTADTSETGGGRPVPGTGTVGSSPDPTTPGGTSDTGAPTTTPPEKPGPSDPAIEYRPVPPWTAVFVPSGRPMAENSQTFFDTVTEDPAAAHAVTSGELAAQGSDGLSRKYDDVAYFEVEKVVVDRSEGVTLNTVKVVREDGTTTRETRKLVFDENNRITSDHG